MRAQHLFLALGLSVAALPAFSQGLPPTFPQEEVLVIVWKEAGRCSVLDRKTTCSRVASLMTGPLQVGRERTILVATEGTGEDVRVRAAQVTTDIKAAGFRKVRSAGTYQ
jgi:hypothetical protein